MGDLISDALSSIMNAEKAIKKEVIIRRCSKLLLNIIEIIKNKGYIGGYEFIPNNRGGELKIKLINKINNIGSIRPRYPCNNEMIESFEKKYLPSMNFGIILISTSKGLITNDDAKKENIGGTLIAYCY